MAQHTYIPESEIPVTPFNTNLPSKKRLKMSTKSGKARPIDEATLGMANTIQSISQKNARMWQIIALVSLTSFFAALGICVYAVNLPKTVPIIVTVDRDGKSRYEGRVDTSYNAKNRIPESAKTYQIKRLIKNMFTWSFDPTVQKTQLRECEAICAGDTARGQLNAFFLENNPFDWIGVKTQTVEIGEPMPLTDRTYNVFFRVDTFSRGRLEKSEFWIALVTIDYMDGDRDQNPLGIYVTSIEVRIDKTGAARAAESSLNELMPMINTITTISSGAAAEDKSNKEQESKEEQKPAEKADTAKAEEAKQ